MLTRVLLLVIALLTAAGVWRLARWYWRPRLVLPGHVTLVREATGLRAYLDVRNEGAGRSRRCRAILVRCERREEFGWLRVEAARPEEPVDDALPAHRADPFGGAQGIAARGSARILLDRTLPETPGTYRLDVAVMNGEEKRSSYVVEIEEVSTR